MGVTTHEDIATEVRGLAVQRCGVWRGFIGDAQRANRCRDRDVIQHTYSTYR